MPTYQPHPSYARERLLRLGVDGKLRSSSRCRIELTSPDRNRRRSRSSLFPHTQLDGQQNPISISISIPPHPIDSDSAPYTKIHIHINQVSSKEASRRIRKRAARAAGRPGKTAGKKNTPPTETGKKEQVGLRGVNCPGPIPPSRRSDPGYGLPRPSPSPVAFRPAAHLGQRCRWLVARPDHTYYTLAPTYRRFSRVHRRSCKVREPVTKAG